MSVIYESIQLKLDVLVFRTIARYDMLVGRDVAEKSNMVTSLHYTQGLFRVEKNGTATFLTVFVSML